MTIEEIISQADGRTERGEKIFQIGYKCDAFEHCVRLDGNQITPLLELRLVIVKMS